MRRFLVGYAVGTLAATTAVPRLAFAQGFSVNEHSTCGMGRAGAAVASPCDDGSTLWYNPAGLAWVGRGGISIGATFIAPSGNFTHDVTQLRSDLNSKVFPVPTLYITRGLTDKVSAGLGVFAPYGLTTDWDPNSEVRFLGYKSVIRAIYVQPTVAVKLGEYLSVGAGFDLDFVHVQLRQRVDLSSQPLPAGSPVPPGTTFGNLGIPIGTDFADVNLHANTTAAGYHVGILIKPTDRISFGARYLSRQHATFKNGTAEVTQVSTGILLPPASPLLPPGAPPGTPLDAILAPQFTGSGPLTTQSVSTAIRLPEQWSFGASLKAIEKLNLEFDITLQHWSVFDALVINFEKLPTVRLPENFRNTTTYRLGAEYQVSPSTALRLGYITHNAAEPTGSVTPNLPEGNRAELTGGLGTRLSGRMHVDLAYQYIYQVDRRGRTVPPGIPAGSTDNGLFAFKASLFGATLHYAF